MKYSQNDRINQVTENTLVVSVDIRGATNFARAYSGAVGCGSHFE